MQGFGINKNKERMAPAFKLPSSQSRKIASWDYKQRRALVLVLLPQAEPHFLKRLEAEYQDYKAAGAELLAITFLQPEELSRLAVELKLSFPLLSDPDGAVYRQYMAMLEEEITGRAELPAALLVADRFGAVSRYALATKPAGLPDRDEIVEMLEFLGNLCNP